MAMADFASNDWSAALAPLAGFPEVTRRAPEGALHRLLTRYLSWRARRETVRMLSRLDGATLRDLGINDVESQVYGAPQDRRRAYDPDWWKRR